MRHTNFHPCRSLALAVSLLCTGATLGLGQVPDQPDAPDNGTPPSDRSEELLRVLRQATTNDTLFAATNRVVLPPDDTSPGTPAAPAVVRTPQTPRTDTGETAAPAGAPAAASTLPAFPALPPPRQLNRPTPSAAATVPGAPVTLSPAVGAPNATPRATVTSPTALGYVYSLPAAPLVQVFDEYAKLTGRTVLHPSTLSGTVTLNTVGNLTREEAIQALQGALALNGITLINQGDKFVKAVPIANSLQEGGELLTRDADAVPNTEEYVTQVVQLKVVPPSEIAELLQTFAKTPQGIIPIDSSMILVLRDYASNVRSMLQLIERVDVKPDSEYQLEVLPIKYGRVTDIFDTMNALISGSTPGSYSGTGGSAGQRMNTVGGFGAGSRLGAAGGSRLGTTGNTGYGGSYNRSYGGNQYYPQQASTPRPVGTATTSSFQRRLSSILNRNQGEDEMSEVLGDARIVPDERSNTLIVYANREDMEMITNIVSKVDVLLAQVLIEGIVVAVAIGDNQELGVSWYQTPKRFGNDFSGTGAINNGFFGVLTNFPSAAPGGFSYWGRMGDDINVAVQAIASDSKVRILQRPRIQTSHAVPGSFFSGSTVPYVTGFYDYGYGGIGGSTRSQVTQVQVGVQLEVTPYITPDGLVVLDIYQDISQLGEYVKIDNNDVPTTTSRSAAATLSVRDGETIMLGGYIEENRTTGKSGVPILKDIPGLGALFRSSSKKNSRAELILLMKVTVLKSPTEASKLAEIERSLLPGLSRTEQEFNRNDQKRN